MGKRGTCAVSFRSMECKFPFRSKRQKRLAISCIWLVATLCSVRDVGKAIVMGCVFNETLYIIPFYSCNYSASCECVSARCCRTGMATLKMHCGMLQDGKFLEEYHATRLSCWESDARRR